MYSFRKIKRNDTRTLERNSVMWIIKIIEYNKVNVKLSDTQLKKLKTAAKKKQKKTGTTLRMSLKIFSEKHLPHELSLTTRQKTNLRNALNNKCQLL